MQVEQVQNRRRIASSEAAFGADSEAGDDALGRAPPRREAIGRSELVVALARRRCGQRRLRGEHGLLPGDPVGANAGLAVGDPREAVAEPLARRAKHRAGVGERNAADEMDRPSGHPQVSTTASRSTSIRNWGLESRVTPTRVEGAGFSGSPKTGVVGSVWTRRYSSTSRTKIRR